MSQGLAPFTPTNPIHGLEQSATSRSPGQTRWRSICARFMVWNPLHRAEGAHIMEQEMHRETAQTLFPTRLTLFSFRDLGMGNDSSLTSLMSLARSSEMASTLSLQTPGAPHHRHNFRAKNQHRMRMTIRPLVPPSPVPTILNPRVSPHTCGSCAIHRLA